MYTAQVATNNFRLADASERPGDSNAIAVELRRKRILLYLVESHVASGYTTHAARNTLAIGSRYDAGVLKPGTRLAINFL